MGALGRYYTILYKGLEHRYPEGSWNRPPWIPRDSSMASSKLRAYYLRFNYNVNCVPSSQSGTRYVIQVCQDVLLNPY
jgi:hypothetical protein